MFEIRLVRPLLLLAGIVAGSFTLGAQNLVKGYVKDVASGEPLTGVSVAIEGSAVGVTTDFEGRFAINVPSDGTLVFGFLGYKTVSEAVAGREVLNVNMETDINRLDEVVVLGYSSVRKAELSSSVVSVEGDKLRNVVSADLGTLLQGKVPGVTVYSPSGAPGTKATVRIRGTGSISADSSPLYVVDGVAGGTFNPNDVASITVLKDAGATALYGASGAGGVIVVTTRKAEKGQDSYVDIKTRTGFKQMLTGRFRMMDSAELYEYFKSYMTKGMLSSFPETIGDTSYDWFDECTRPGLTQDYYMSVSGSSGKLSYLASLDYYDEKGTQIFSNYHKFSAHSNINAEILPNLDMTLRLNYSTDKSVDGSVLGIGQMPFDNPKDVRTGGYVCITDALRPDNGELWWGHDKNNPLHAPSVNDNKNNSGEFVGDLVLTWKIAEPLSLTSTNRYGDYNSHYKHVISPEAKNGTYPSGQVYQTASWGKSFNTTNILKFSHTFAQTHSLTAFAGWEWGQSWNEYIGASGTGLSNGLKVLDTSVAENVRGSRTEAETYSFFGQVQYSYAEKYILNATLRADASSVFAPGKRVGYFPAVSGAWVASSEKFMRNQNVLSLLKFRASYGSTGNSGLPPYIYLDVYDFPKTAQYQDAIGGIPSTVSNPNLHWEKAVMLNLGLDMSFLNFLTVNVDVYRNENRDLLLNVPLAPSSGFMKRIDNTGTIRNSGIELMLTSDIINRENIRWTTSFNIGHNRNVIVSLPNHEDIIATSTTGSQIYREGEPLYSWYMPKWLGVDPENGDPLWEGIRTDADGNKVKSPTPWLNPTTDQQIVGCAQPDFSGGLFSEFRLYGFSLSLNLQFMYGNDVFNFSRRTCDSDGAYSDINSMSIDNGLGWSRWKRKGDQATHPRPRPGGNKNANEVSSRYLEDGSYIRVKNLTLSYDLPKAVLKKLNLKSARISLSGDNLYTYSRFSGMDPEVDLSSTLGSTINSGTYLSNYPLGRLFSVGLDVKF